MRKLIVTIAALVVLALLAALGINLFRNSGPRDRVKGDDGEKIIVEELSWYIHGDKQNGRIFKPTDENGNCPDSLGTRPVAMFFHDPMKSEMPESLLKSLSSMGVIGYSASCPEKSKDIETLIKRMGRESFATEDLLFVMADSYSADAVVKAIIKVGHKTAGLILFEPALQGKSGATVAQHSNEILSISSEQMPQKMSLVEDYMEVRGAFK